MGIAKSLGERKRLVTRAVIAEAAHELFAARGFDSVTVADVAEAAQVSIKTVFNHFRCKEELFYDQQEVIRQRLVDALRERAEGTTVLDAFSQYLRADLARPRDQHAGDADIARARQRILASSPALQAYQREMFTQYENAISDLLVAEGTADGGDNIEAHVVAGMLVSILRGLFLLRMSCPVDDDPKNAARRMLRHCERGFAVVAAGLAGYGRKAP
jgi:AcrR family transcriptional regulator